MDAKDERTAVKDAQRTMPLAGLSRSSGAVTRKPNPFRSTPMSIPAALQQEDETAAFSMTPTASTSRLAGPSTPRGSSRLAAPRVEDVCEACLAGDLDRLKSVLAGSDAFKVVNSLHPRTGRSPLQLASARGRLSIVEYLLEQCGALADLDDSSGEAPIHAAAFRGHLDVVRALVEHTPGTAEARDVDGWTPLHNATARGHLGIVRYLVELDVDADAQSRLGYSPLMCAASRGQLPVVAYLLSRDVDPLLRNGHGETAYDAAVASFELHISDLLASAEAARRPDYSSLALHSFHAVTMHENQRLGRDGWTGRALTRTDGRSAYTLLPDHRRAARSQIQPPTLTKRDELVIDQEPSTEQAWYWLSDWFVDLTPPGLDSDGWQYASSFDATQWSSAPLAGEAKSVRRRRWARLMRRRLDLPPWPFADSAAGQDFDDSADYLARAKWQAGVNHLRDSDAFSTTSAASEHSSLGGVRRTIGRLEAAIVELATGSSGDHDAGRRQVAQTLIETYSTRIADLRSMLGPDEAADDDSFVYQSPASSRQPTPSPPRRSSSLPPPPDLTPWLSRAADVPTRETPAPRPVRADRQTASTVTWQADDAVQSCPLCSRRFTFFLRRHHCRRCGRVVCASCSPYFDPITPGHSLSVRSCHPCHTALITPPSPSIPSSPLPSELADCPVCGVTLGGLDASAHLRDCLDSGQVSLTNRYVVSKLPAESALVGTECIICFEELAVGDEIARLPCLDVFHASCCRSWIDRGNGCPVHQLN